MRSSPAAPAARLAIAVLLVALLALAAALAVASSSSSSSSPATATSSSASVHGRRTIGFGQIAFDFAGPERWAARARRARRTIAELRAELRAQRRAVLDRPDVVEAINLAAATYGHGAELWRKARCETGGTFDAGARNLSSGARGLFQFLASTWASTPYGRFDVSSPYANALAAGWMHAHGRAGEWVCQ
jgi:hypothetical protein